MDNKEQLRAICIKTWNEFKDAKELLGENSESALYFRTSWYAYDNAYTLIFGEVLSYE